MRIEINVQTGERREIELTPEEIAALPAPDPQEHVRQIESALQQAMDKRAKERGYDNILSACSYAAQPPGAPFQAEGAAFLAWRSEVWATAYSVLAQVQAGQRPMPSVDEALASMPTLVLPE